MKRELAIEFSRVTEAAVQAMLIVLNQVPINGRIVIGEGEIDEAPMLYIGEAVGTGAGEAVDIAVHRRNPYDRAGEGQRSDGAGRG